MLYTQEVLASGARPVRDASVRFQADRGGVRLMPPPTLADVESGVGVWTNANDITPSSPSTKPIVTMTCPSEVETIVQAITARLKMGNFRERFGSEQVAAWMRELLAEQARIAEQQLLGKMISEAPACSPDIVLGAARYILVVMDRGGRGLPFSPAPRRNRSSVSCRSGSATSCAPT